MNDEQAKALGLRAVACTGWRWMPGMLAREGAGDGVPLCVGDVQGTLLWGWPDGVDPPWVCRADGPDVVWPDFRDPATLGCLLALVREAWGDDTLVAISVNATAWELHCHAATNTQSQLPGWTYPTFEAEALVEALEAATARVSL